MARIFGKKKEEPVPVSVVAEPPKIAKEEEEEELKVEEKDEKNKKKDDNVREVIVEREISLSLINDKLNVILNILQELKEE